MSLQERGSCLTDVAAGDITMMFDDTPTCKLSIDAGKIKASTAVGDKRSKILSQVPSAAEVGLPRFGRWRWSACLCLPERRGNREAVQR